MKRFYKDVTVDGVDGGWQVMLDGRPIKTQLGKRQVVPSRTLAHALAKEWAEQGEKIDTKTFIFRDLTDFALDVVANERDVTIDKLLSYGETDTLCYRADPDEAFYQRQQECWEPLLEQLETHHEIRFNRISGIMHKPQPPATLDKLRAHLAEQDDLTLAALTMLASLAASLAVGLLAIDDAINDPQPLWRDATLEEEWQAEMWGRDAEAEEARERKWEAFSAAVTFAKLARS